MTFMIFKRGPQTNNTYGWRWVSGYLDCRWLLVGMTLYIMQFLLCIFVSSGHVLAM
jgi:hypothetical protein